MERNTSRTRNKAVWGSRATVAAALIVAALTLAACSSQVRQGEGSSYLILSSLTGTSGANPGTFSPQLFSDVITVVDGIPSTFNDPGRAILRLAMKDVNGLAPTTNNFITVTQYRVEYTRTDGRNVQGVDVPHAIDGAVTQTVEGESEVGFTLVRHTAKQEAPLKTLQSGGSPLTVIARVTFYGHDVTGRSVTVSGNMEITFSNFGD